MTLQEFTEQDIYCRENNTPEGLGCDGCPAIDRNHCADALRNLCGQFLANLNKPEFYDISRRLNEYYGLSLYNQLALIKGEIEFSK